MITRTADHQYRRDDGPFVPGATGVIRVMDKGWPFENWLRNEVAFSAVRNMEFLAGLIEKGGENAAAAWLSKLPDFQRDKAADIGSQVHDLADRISKKQKPPVPSDLVPFVQGELRFLRDFKPTKRRSELMVYSDKGYGATLDELCEIDGELCLIERKTGKNVYEDQVRMQLAAQKNADVIQVGARTVKMPAVARTFVLHLRPDQYGDGYKLTEYHLTDIDYDAFLACLRLTDLACNTQWKGTPMSNPLADAYDQIAEGFATAALELRAIAEGAPSPSQAPTEASWTETDDWEEPAGKDLPGPSGAAAVCPAHGEPYRDGKFGPYCASLGTDPKWTNQRGYCQLTPKNAAAYLRQKAAR